MGVLTFDPWSLALSNAYNVASTLYDCFHSSIDVSSYRLKPTIRPVCIGVTDGQKHVGDCNYGDCTPKTRSYTTMSTLLRDVAPLSVFVKMDVEGAEWDVINTIDARDFGKIVQLDLELHWCMDSANPPDYGNIAEALARLRANFYVLMRAVDVVKKRKIDTNDMAMEVAGDTPGEPHFANASCNRLLDGQHNMISISYLNKKTVGRLA